MLAGQEQKYLWIYIAAILNVIYLFEEACKGLQYGFCRSIRKESHHSFYKFFFSPSISMLLVWIGMRISYASSLQTKQFLSHCIFYLRRSVQPRYLSSAERRKNFHFVCFLMEKIKDIENMLHQKLVFRASFYCAGIPKLSTRTRTVFAVVVGLSWCII